MNPLPLKDPKGRTFAYACETCETVHVMHRFNKRQSTDDNLSNHLATVHTQAETCCRCRYCGEPSWEATQRLCQAHQEEEDAERKIREEKWKEIDARGEEAYTEALKFSTDVSAAKLLVNLMSDISENCYCAGWLSGLEYSLWAFVIGGPGDWGMSRINEWQVESLRSLSQKCGGWWAWHEEYQREIFYPLEEWQKMYADEGFTSEKTLE